MRKVMNDDVKRALPSLRSGGDGYHFLLRCRCEFDLTSAAITSKDDSRIHHKFMDYSQKTKQCFLLLIWDLSDDVSGPFLHFMNQQ